MYGIPEDELSMQQREVMRDDGWIDHAEAEKLRAEVARLERERRNWLDTDLLARAALEQEKIIRQLREANAILQIANE